MITGLLCFPATTMQAAPPFCQIRRSDGTSLPIGFRVLGLSPRGPRQLGVLAVHALRSKRTLLKRLPEMLATYEDGRQFVCPPSDGMYASVLCQGVWEPVESAAIRHVLRPGDSAVDVGANVGWHAIGMASIVGDSGMIWAVEPVPRTRDDLQRNVGRNPHLRVTVVPYALGASRGETSVHVFEGLPDGHASMSTLGREDYVRHDVPQIKLDDLVTEAGMRPAFVKIDVEGSDLDVLLGARELAADSHAPIWLLEVNWEVSRALGYEPSDLLNCLNKLGDYRTYRLSRRGSVTPETEPRLAPHGSAWLVVPRHQLGRVAGLDPSF